MKTNKYNKVLVGVFSLLFPLSTFLFTSCEDKLELTNPNQQTTATFGNTADDLEECVIAAYNHMRMEGSYARVGYTIDLTRGDEVWNSSQVWYLPFDDLNVPATDEICMWPWREWYYTINVCNFILSRTDAEGAALTEQMKRIKGQALFIRGLAYYNLAGYFQTPILITDYNSYSDLNSLYGTNNTYDEAWDQVEKDFAAAIDLLPTRALGGQWAQGRATSGAAAGFYARALMMRHKYSEALTVLKDIIGGKYGNYKLMDNYGDNFREGSKYGTDDEWTPVNTSKNATQGHAVESNFGPGDCGGWADLSASPWLYQLFKAERTTSGGLDPRLYWTIGTYEAEWDGFEYGNSCYTLPMSADNYIVTNNNYGGLPIAKFTNLRTGLYDKVVTGLHCGINLRMMRYSDVLLRAAECENEVSGPTQQAIDWINQVRSRAGLAGLKLADFDSKDKLFEQIANVERPKEFGCEFGRGFDLIRWGFFYDSSRIQQLKEHAAVNFWTKGNYTDGVITFTPKDAVDYSSCSKSSFDSWTNGHEFLPIYQGTLNDNPNLKGNSANFSTSNADALYGAVHPVVKL